MGLTFDAPVQEEIDRIVYIYETTFPTHTIRLYLYKSDQNTGAVDDVWVGDLSPGPDRLGPGFLGLIVKKAASESAPVLNVFIKLPRPATKAEIAASDTAGALRSRKTRALFGLSPLSFEQAKFHLEQRWQRQSAERHGWTKISRARGAIAPDPADTDRDISKRPAILIGFHWLEHGGAEKLAFDTAHWAIEAGFRVFVVTEHAALHRLADKLPQHEDVHFIRTDQYLAKTDMPLFVRKLVARENIRAIHIHHCIPLYEALSAVKLMFPDVVVFDSTHIIEYSDGGFPRISGVWSNFIDHHHVISRELADMYQQKFQVRDRVLLGRLIDRGVMEASQAEGHKAFSLETGKDSYTIAFVGRMSHQKRPVLLALMLKALKAWAETNSKSLTFEVVGDGPYLDVFKRLLAKYQLGSTTNLHPADADVNAVMAEADILLLPSSNEGLALVCYEAIQMGCIPISSDVGGQNELLPPELLLTPNPRQAIKQVVEIVTRLTSDATFLAQAKSGLEAQLATITAEPTAYEVLLPLYSSISEGDTP